MNAIAAKGHYHAGANVTFVSSHAVENVMPICPGQVRVLFADCLLWLKGYEVMDHERYCGQRP